MATLFHFPSSKARVRAMSSTNWAEVPGGKGLVSMVSKLKTTVYPALFFPSKTKLFHQLPESTQTHVHWVSDAIQPSHPLSSPYPPALTSDFPSIRVFSNESVLHIRWPKYWSFSFSIGPSNEYSGLVSFRMDWLYLIAVQRTLKSLLQHHSSKASILWCLAFFIVQLSHPFTTTGKNHSFD